MTQPQILGELIQFDIIVEPLAQHALATYGVQRHLRRGFERSRPGGIDGHPIVLYIWSNSGESFSSAASASTSKMIPRCGVPALVSPIQSEAKVE